MSDKTPQPKSIIANFNSALNQRADQLGVFVEKNGKNLVVVFVAFLVICGLFFAYSFYTHSVAVKKFD